MKSLEWVLDTWLIAIAQNLADARSFDAVALLHEIKSGHRITLDYEQRIKTEYLKNLRGTTHAGYWWREMVRVAGRIVWRSGKVDANIRKELLNDLGFDPSDLVFVGVALAGPDKIIVSEDSDYSQDVKVYLSDHCGITVLSLQSALVLARDE